MASQAAPDSNRAAEGWSDESGRFGEFGGRYVPEVLVSPLRAVESAWREARTDSAFADQLASLLRDFVGRPTPLYLAARLSALHAGARIYFKREDLNHTGSHKLNNCVGQVLLAQRLGKERVIAETGAGQHGVAIASACARVGLPCTVFMGAHDMARQETNVFRMRMLGAQVERVAEGSGTLKDAMNSAFRAWAATPKTTYLALGTAAGPHPYPSLVRDFQRIIGEEARAQVLALEGRLPDYLVAPIGGGSNAIGLFHAFRHDLDVRMVGVEAAGSGGCVPDGAASIGAGHRGVLHGALTMVLQDREGQIGETESISAGLDYPAVGPEHAWLSETGRVHYVGLDDREALDAFRVCSSLEGIIPALESAHAIAHARKIAKQDHRGNAAPIIIVNLSGRGDKDLPTVMAHPTTHETGLSHPSSEKADDGG